MDCLSLSIFISYSRKDLRIARKIEAILHSNGLRAWRDLEYIPFGMNTEDEIKKAICNECGAFVLIVTEKSLCSDFIWNIELPAALERARRSSIPFSVVPVFIGSSLLGRFSEKSIKSLGEDLGNNNGIILKNSNDISKMQILSGRILAALLHQQYFTKIRIFSHGNIPTMNSDEVVIDIRQSFKNGIPSQKEWREVIMPGYNNLKSALLKKKKPQKSIWLPSRIHLSAALAFGWAFREITGFKLIASDTLIEENPEEICDNSSLKKMNEIVLHGDSSRDNLAVLVSLAKDVRPTVNKLLSKTDYRYKVAIHLSADEINSTAIINTTHAKILAKQTIYSLLQNKNKHKTGHTDLFISASVQFAAYLGYYLNACGSFTLWQYNTLEDIHYPCLSLADVFDNDT